MKTGGGGAFGNIAEGLAWDDAWGNGRWSWLAGQGGALEARGKLRLRASNGHVDAKYVRRR
jgi:hypothetical protein